MELIDSHCHLYALEQASTEQIISNAEKAFIKEIVCIGASNGYQSATDSVTLSQKFPNVFATIGIHPHCSGKFQEIKKLEHLADNPKVVAIGETGLDFFRDWAPVENQYQVFRDTIAFAKNHKKPLIIHCRTAGEECLKVLKEEHAEHVGGVFHCFAEDAEYAKKLVDLNFIVSIPGTLTFKSATQLRETVKAIPLERIMLETDAPYMAPEPFRGKPSEPAHVLYIAKKLAEVKDISLEEVARVTTNTARKFFGI